MRDGSLGWWLVIAQRRDRHGRWCICIGYYPNATIGESGDWYLFDATGSGDWSRYCPVAACGQLRQRTLRATSDDEII